MLYSVSAADGSRNRHYAVSRFNLVRDNGERLVGVAITHSGQTDHHLPAFPPTGHVIQYSGLTVRYVNQQINIKVVMDPETLEEHEMMAGKYLLQQTLLHNNARIWLLFFSSHSPRRS